MAKQITQLPVAASVAASDVFPLDQSGTTKQATLTTIAAGLPTGTGTGGLVRQTNPVLSGNVSVSAGALSSLSGSLVDIARWETTNVNVSFLRLTEVRNSTGSDWTTATTRLQKWVDVVPQGFIEFNPAGLNYAVALGTVNGPTNVNVLTVTGSAGGNNVGIGTTNTPSKLTVAGEIRLLANGNALLFTDTGGSTPYMVSAVDGNFYFAGTTAAGAGRAILQCAMRSDTSPLQVNVPLRVGSDGSPVTAVYTAVLTGYAPPAIAANGGIQFVDVTVTGATNSMVCMVECPVGLSNNSIIVKANYISADTVRVYFINPTASSVTLTATSFRIACIKF